MYLYHEHFCDIHFILSCSSLDLSEVKVGNFIPMNSKTKPEK